MVAVPVPMERGCLDIGWCTAISLASWADTCGPCRLRWYNIFWIFSGISTVRSRVHMVSCEDVVQPVWLFTSPSCHSPRYVHKTHLLKFIKCLHTPLKSTPQFNGSAHDVKCSWRLAQWLGLFIRLILRHNWRFWIRNDIILLRSDLFDLKWLNLYIWFVFEVVPHCRLRAQLQIRLMHCG